MKHLKEILITSGNIEHWPKFKNLFDAGKIVPDVAGRMRYLHGAPVGRLILVKIAQDGSPVYKESTDEWFDPDSQKAEKFQWPK